QSSFALRSQTSLMKRDLGLTTEAGALKENIKKNRYKDILPYDQSRVVLTLLTTDSDSDYINASFIKGASADNRYIASQAPLSSTVTDFWRMIWQHGVKRKCECYWAPVHRSTEFGPFTINNNNPPFIFILLLLQDSRSVIQYQFLSWPDHDVPCEAAEVLDLLERVRDSQRTHSSPLLIHCSAGCGRTGVICALDYIYDLLVTKQITTDFSIMKIILELRRQRPSTVQTKVSGFTSAERGMEIISKRFYITEFIIYIFMKYLDLLIFLFFIVIPKPHSLPPSATPIYDTATPANHRPAEGSLSLHSNGAYQLVPGNKERKGRAKRLLSLPAKQLSPENEVYEEFSPSVTNMSNICSPGGIGFNCRIQKPRGPRDPPAEWSRLER
uniref:protein-tyrosine-phosphatase n=1 Tax=Scophthalmus maximus TaxID=52904 RepID=A0A8D3DPI9_SCOMX